MRTFTRYWVKNIVSYTVTTPGVTVMTVVVRGTDYKSGENNGQIENMCSTTTVVYNSAFFIVTKFTHRHI